MRAFTVTLFAVLVMGTYAKLTAVQRLDRGLIEVEIMLAEMDLGLTKGMAQDWREDTGAKLKEIRASVPSAFAKIRSSLGTFFKELTTEEGAPLPDWVYKSFGGALQEVLSSLEKRMQEEDGAFQTAVLQVLRNFVRNYRTKINEAAKKVPAPGASPAPAPATSEPATESPAPAEPAPDAGAQFNDFFDV